MTDAPPLARGEIWLAHVGQKSRPVVVLTRDQVLDVRELVTVAEITTTIRGHRAEVELDHETVGLAGPSVVNCDGLHTIRQRTLTSKLGLVGPDVLARVCAAVQHALGC